MVEDVAFVHEQNELDAGEQLVRAHSFPEDHGVFLRRETFLENCSVEMQESLTSRLTLLSSTNVWSKALMGARNIIAGKRCLGV